MIITLVEEENKPLFADNSDLFEINPSKIDVSSLKRTKVYKEYQITFNHKEITVFCLVYRDDNKNRYAYIPSYILPRRAYPVAVYLYAIALYLSSNLSMRKTAITVKKKFGLATFSHSTISRVLKRVSESIQHLTIIEKEEEKVAVEKEPSAKTMPLTLRTDRTWEENIRSRYIEVLTYLGPVLKENEFSEGSIINFNYYRRTKRYII